MRSFYAGFSFHKWFNFHDIVFLCVCGKTAKPRKDWHWIHNKSFSFYSTRFMLTIGILNCGPSKQSQHKNAEIWYLFCFYVKRLCFGIHLFVCCGPMCVMKMLLIFLLYFGKFDVLFEKFDFNFVYSNTFDNCDRKHDTLLKLKIILRSFNISLMFIKKREHNSFISNGKICLFRPCLTLNTFNKRKTNVQEENSPHKCKRKVLSCNEINYNKVIK